MFKPYTLLLVALCAAPAGAGTISINATDNSRLDEASPDNVWLDWGTLDITNYLPGQERNGIFKFSLAALPAGSTVTGARLWLFDTGWNDLDLQSLYWHPDSSWSGSTVTWNTFSTASNHLVGAINGVSGWQYNGWDIGLSEWDWASDAAQGAATFQLRMAYGDYSYNGNVFYSLGYADSQMHPYLELEYTGGSQTPEPGAAWLLGAGLATLAIRARHARSAKR
jgi:hypothetical protein